MPTGKLITLNPLRQYGLIEAMPENVYVNLAALRQAGIVNPRIGDAVRYRIEIDGKGRERATDVEPVDQAEAA